MSECPPIEVVDDFVSGRLDDDRVRCHVERCDTCNPLAERMRRENVLLRELTRVGYDQPGGDKLSGAVQVAGYQILAEIQRGGQGAVYRAIQQSTHRTVALKVLLGGPFATPSQRRRFEREIDVVARLRHPNIVTLYDSGIAEGRYYFAMEFVDGERLDHYVAQRRLDVRSTLRLFAKVCAGVNHAHEVGVMHRDLKPGNVFVDQDGEPRVLDFGLARPTDGDGAAATLLVTTQANAFLGTFAYAAPEQVRGERNQVDTRSDVYSLGVILHELLTQSPAALRDGPAVDARRVVTGRATERPSELRREIDRDVDAIVMRCLEDDPANRYQTAGSLQRDIEHYLSGEPVNARRKDRNYTGYVLMKWVARHKLDVAAGFGVVVLATASIVSMFAGRNGESASPVSTTNAAADEWSTAYAELESVLASAAGGAKDKDTALVAQMLDRGVARADALQDAIAQARLRVSLGRGYIAINELAKAESTLRRAWEVVAARPAGDPLAMDALNGMIEVFEANRDAENAEKFGALREQRKLQAASR